MRRASHWAQHTFDGRLLDLKPEPTSSMKMTKRENIPEDHLSEIVEMALSDDIQFTDIERQYGLSEKAVKALMRDTLKPGSYRSWRKRVRVFSDRREHYK